MQIPLSKKLFLIDNSKTDVLKKFEQLEDVEYLFNHRNLGFGKAHNLVLDKINNYSEYHLILNPDVFFSMEVIPNLIKELKLNKEVALVAPKAVFPNSELQYTFRKFPTFFDLINNRIRISKSKNAIHLHQNIDLSKPFYPEAVHGCFMLFNTSDFIVLNGFDERYFLYMEDIDICKKINKNHKKILFIPTETITHIYRRSSTKKISLFYRHLVSAIQYFRKWS